MHPGWHRIELTIFNRTGGGKIHKLISELQQHEHASLQLTVDGLKAELAQLFRSGSQTMRHTRLTNTAVVELTGDSQYAYAGAIAAIAGAICTNLTIHGSHRLCRHQ